MMHHEKQPPRPKYCKNCKKPTQALSKHNEYWILFGCLFWGTIIGLITQKIGLTFVFGGIVGVLGFIVFHFLTKHCILCKSPYWKTK